MDAVTWARLIAELRERGWSERERWVYAPRGGLWFSVEHPWHEPLPEFRARFLARLDRCRQAMEADDDVTEWQAAMQDHETLVAAIAGVIDEW